MLKINHNQQAPFKSTWITTFTQEISLVRRTFLVGFWTKKKHNNFCMQKEGKEKTPAQHNFSTEERENQLLSIILAFRFINGLNFSCMCVCVCLLVWNGNFAHAAKLYEKGMVMYCMITRNYENLSIFSIFCPPTAL